MKILLKTTYPCLVKTGAEECELGQNDTLEIENEKNVFVYPQNPKIIPFYINLDSPKDCERYSFFTHGEEKFLLLENVQKFEIKTKEKLNFAGKNVEICVENGKICFETTDKKIECSTNDFSQKFECSKIKNFACVQFEKELFLFSVKNCKVYHFLGEIEIDGNQISVTKKFYDSENREKRSVFRIEDDLELENEEFVSMKKDEKIKSLAPFKLMESVKAKDYANGLNFLSAKLQSQIDANQIKEFFGNFTDFLPISTTEFITINGRTKNFVQFSMSGALIDDISVDNLN